MSWRYLIIPFLLVASVTFVRGQQPFTWSAPVVLETDNSDWTRMVQLNDGSWLAAYMYVGFRNRIRVKRSFDNMRTWQFATDVIESDRDLDNPSLCLLPNGNIVLAFRSYPQRVYYIETFVSTDQGNSFQKQSTVDGGYNPQGVYEPYLYVLSDGSLACFYASEAHQLENPSYSQTLSEKVSRDGGYTWGPEILAVAQPGASRPGTSNIVTLQGNVLAMFYEVCGDEDCRGHVSYSSDGVTWSGEIGPLIPETYQAVVAVGMSDGLILVTSNLKDMIVSTDYTNTWHDPQAYPFTYGNWPALYQTGPNEFAVVVSNGGPNGELGEYIRFGTVDPTAFRFPSAPLCKGPTNTRPQNCR